MEKDKVLEAFVNRIQADLELHNALHQEAPLTMEEVIDYLYKAKEKKEMEYGMFR